MIFHRHYVTAAMQGWKVVSYVSMYVTYLLTKFYITNNLDVVHAQIQKGLLCIALEWKMLYFSLVKWDLGIGLPDTFVNLFEVIPYTSVTVQDLMKI